MTSNQVRTTRTRPAGVGAFVLWTLTGALLALGIAGAFTIGLFALPLAAGVGGLAAVRASQSNRAILGGLATGVGLVAATVCALTLFVG